MGPAGNVIKWRGDVNDRAGTGHRLSQNSGVSAVLPPIRDSRFCDLSRRLTFPLVEPGLSLAFETVQSLCM